MYEIALEGGLNWRIMSIRFIAIVILICTACQSGKIPCPKIKTAKLQKNYRPPASAYTAKATSAETESERKEGKPNDIHFIQNVSVEEWDCPKPGSKHYMPKSVKENIKRNKKKIESDYQKQQTDSLRMENGYPWCTHMLPLFYLTIIRAF